MQHLQDTYEAHIGRQEGLQEVLDVTSSPSWNQGMSSAPYGEAMDAGSELEREGKQDEPTITTQQDHHTTKPEEIIQQPQASTPQRPPRRLSTRHIDNYCEEEVHPCPRHYEQPYGK